jgi:hypothetical protein
MIGVDPSDSWDLWQKKRMNTKKHEEHENTMNTTHKSKGKLIHTRYTLVVLIGPIHQLNRIKRKILQELNSLWNIDLLGIEFHLGKRPINWIELHTLVCKRSKSSRIPQIEEIPNKEGWWFTLDVKSSSRVPSSERHDAISYLNSCLKLERGKRPIYIGSHDLGAVW